MPSFESWGTSQKRPPLVATLVTFLNAGPKVEFRFDHSIDFGNDPHVEISSNGSTVATVPASRMNGSANGDWVAEWPASGVGDTLLSANSILVHPQGWGDWFPIWFRIGVVPMCSTHMSKVKFSDGKGLFDREKVTSQTANVDGQTPYSRLQSHSFTIPYNNKGTGPQQPFPDADVHGRYPYGGQMITTAVGRGDAWVANEQPNGFKSVYICFENRRADEEASASNGGVASGTGWHQIGSPAETVVNDLENGPILVGQGKTNPVAPPSGAKLSYGLTDVATVRPCCSRARRFLTSAGDFHWFAFQQSSWMCADIVVSPPPTPSSFEAY